MSWICGIFNILQHKCTNRWRYIKLRRAGTEVQSFRTKSLQLRVKRWLLLEVNGRSCETLDREAVLTSGHQAGREYESTVSER